MSGKRRFRPTTGALLGMMALNAVVSVFALKLAFALFGVASVVAAHVAAVHMTSVAAHWDALWPMVPGAAVGFSLLWFWLIISGRTRGMNWGSAFFGGIAIGYADVLCGGLMVGTLHGNPGLGVLMGFVMLLMVPQVWAAMAAFGLGMALFNGNMAHRWIESKRAR